MYQNLSSYLEFMGAVSFAFVITDYYNVTILNFLDFGPQNVRNQISILKEKINEINSRKDLDDDLLKELRWVDILVENAENELKRILKTSSFSGISLIAGMHCVFCLLLIGFEEILKGCSVVAFQFLYSMLLIFFIGLFYFLDIRKYRDMTFRNMGALMIFAFSIICSFVFSYKLIKYQFATSELVVSICVAVIPFLPLAVYFFHTIFIKAKQVKEIGSQLSDVYFRIKKL